MGMFQSGGLPVCHLSVLHIVILCFISVVLGGWGFWPVVGRGVLFFSLVVFSGWSPEWGHISELGLGLG